MRFPLALAAVAALSSFSALGADLPPDTVLVRKGDITVTAGDFLASVARLPDDQRFSYRADVNRISSTVSSLFIARTLAREARAQGIDKEPEIQARLRLAEESLLSQIYMERFEKAISTPDYEARAREVYKADSQRFRTPEQVTLKHLLVNFQGRSEEEAKRRAEEARAKLLAGESFSSLVRTYSNDPMARSNDGVYSGAYNLFIAEVGAAARVAKVGVPSELIRTSEGYHLIVVQERLPAQVIPFEKAKASLIAAEQAKFRKGVIEKKLSAITQSKEVTLYTDEIAALRTEVDRDLLTRLHREKAQEEREEKERLMKETSQPPAK
jgi:peptidyl-prolyl cis-trans isomerase C